MALALRLAASGLLFFAAVAHALAPGSISYPGGNTGQVHPARMNSTAAGQAQRAIEKAGNSARAYDTFKGKIGTKDFPVVHARTYSPAKVATAIARGAKAFTGVGAIAWAAENIRCRPNAAGGWACDVGGQKEMQSTWEITLRNGSKVQGAPSSLYAQYVQDEMAWWQRDAARRSTADGNSWGAVLSGSAGCTEFAPNVWRCEGQMVTLRRNGVDQTSQAFSVVLWPIQALVCPAGSTDVGGTCSMPPATWQDVTETKAQELIEPKISQTPEEALRELLKAGADVDALVNPDSSTLTGPTSVTQDPTKTTITSPTGQPQVKTETVTNPITYNPTTNTFTWLNVTTINNFDGTTETKEETPPEEKSECEKNPQSLACAELDQPEAGELEKKDREVTWNPDSGWGAPDASCPAPYALSHNGQVMQFDFEPMCNFATMTRPVVIALCSVVAAFIFIGAIKQ